MPTTRPRHTITETEEISRAIDEAAQHWPEDGGLRSRLLVRLIQEGHRALREHDREALNKRREAVRETSGVLPGVYSDDYLDNLRAEWPE